MRTILKFAILATFVGFVACGPSAEEQAEKAKQDSIKQADSLAKIEMAAQATADSIAKVEAIEKAKQDSIRIADSLAKAKPGKKK
jgi:hypothetical protein